MTEPQKKKRMELRVGVFVVVALPVFPPGCRERGEPQQAERITCDDHDIFLSRRPIRCARIEIVVFEFDLEPPRFEQKQGGRIRIHRVGNFDHRITETTPATNNRSRWVSRVSGSRRRLS